jgi:hypothetical protein
MCWDQTHDPSVVRVHPAPQAKTQVSAPWGGTGDDPEGDVPRGWPRWRYSGESAQNAIPWSDPRVVAGVGPGRRGGVPL